ncbi:uncharacterized protein TEOVI_000553500 [Trypanosoma equiperdum]|uniref:SAC3/GANP/THP3 conserved domain-containing protein n=1 Tax=Trypanosoma equiperdum TaxID=5694 RepID=A0A1G4I2B9_TRYEQ|nr:hypothetical protein, conserved [Trypanosoma equiperdum]
MSGLSVRAALSTPPFSTFCEFKVDEPPRRGQLAALCGGNRANNTGDGISQLPAVEPYGRSAAGVVVEPAHLRTPTALEKSMHFLVQHYLREPHGPAVFLAPFDVWRYLWDRMRQVRTNWVPQLPPVGAELRDDGCGERIEGNVNEGGDLRGGILQQQCETITTKQMVRRESRRRLRWLEFTVAALSVGGANLCRSVEGCRHFVQEKQNFFESIAQCFSDLVVSYRAEQRLRNSEMFSAVILFYGLSQLTKIENRAGFFRVSQVTVSSVSGGTTVAAPTSVFEPPSSSVDFGSVYRELSYIPCMARSRHVRIALKIIHCWCQREWFRFFYLCRTARLTVLQRAILSHSFSYARFRAVVDLVTANVVVYGKGRVRGSMAVSELAELLLFTPKHCVELLLTMGLGPQLSEDRTVLRLSQQDSSPYTTQEQIFRHLEETGGKPRLCLPTLSSFVGFTVWQRAFELFPSAFDGDAAGTVSGASSPPVTDLENMRCPVNLMQLLEPYCPPYNEDVAALELLDAGSEWFDGIQASRERMLAWCVNNASRAEVKREGMETEAQDDSRWGGNATMGCEYDGVSGSMEGDELGEELREVVAEMDRESVSTRSSVFDDDDETELTHNETGFGLHAEEVCGEEDVLNNESDYGEEDEALREANILINSLQNSSIYQLASSNMQKETTKELPDTAAATDPIKGADEAHAAAQGSSQRNNEDEKQEQQKLDENASELVLYKPSSGAETAVTPLPSDHPGVMSPTLHATVEAPESESSRSTENSEVEIVAVAERPQQANKKECESGERNETLAQDQSNRSMLFGSQSAVPAFFGVSKFPPISFGNLHSGFPGSPTQQKANVEENVQGKGDSALKRSRSEEIDNNATIPGSYLSRQQVDTVLDTTTSSVDDRIMLLPSEVEEESEQRTLKAEVQQKEDAPRQRMRVERGKVDTDTSERSVPTTSHCATSSDVDPAPRLPEAGGPSLVSYKDVIKACVDEMKGKEQRWPRMSEADVSLLPRAPSKPSREQSLQVHSPLPFCFSTGAEYSAVALLLQELPQWVDTFTSYLVSFYSASYSDVTACRHLTDIICRGSRSQEITGWMCRGFTPSMIPYSETGEDSLLNFNEELSHDESTNAPTRETPILRLTSKIIVFGSDLREHDDRDEHTGTDGASLFASSGLSGGAGSRFVSRQLSDRQHLSLGHWIAALMLPPAERARVLREGILYHSKTPQSTDMDACFDEGGGSAAELGKSRDSDHIGIWEQMHVLRAADAKTTPAAWRLLSTAAAAWRRPLPSGSTKMLLQTQIALHAVDFRDVPRLRWTQDTQTSSPAACKVAACECQREHPTVIIALDTTRHKEFAAGMEVLRSLISQSVEQRAVLLAGVIVVLYTESVQEDEEKKKTVEEFFWSTWERCSKVAEESELQAAATLYDDKMPPWRAMYQNTIRRAVVKARSQAQMCSGSSPDGSFLSATSLPSSIESGDGVDSNMKRSLPYRIQKLIKSRRVMPSGAPPDPTLLVVPIHSLMDKNTRAFRSQYGNGGFTAFGVIALKEMLNSSVHSLLQDYEVRCRDFLRKNKFDAW